MHGISVTLFIMYVHSFTSIWELISSFSIKEISHGARGTDLSMLKKMLHKLILFSPCLRALIEINREDSTRGTTQSVLTYLCPSDCKRNFYLTQRTSPFFLTDPQLIQLLYAVNFFLISNQDQFSWSSCFSLPERHYVWQEQKGLPQGEALIRVLLTCIPPNTTFQTFWVLFTSPGSVDDKNKKANVKTKAEKRGIMRVDPQMIMYAALIVFSYFVSSLVY